MKKKILFLGLFMILLGHTAFAQDYCSDFGNATGDGQRAWDNITFLIDNVTTVIPVNRGGNGTPCNSGSILKDYTEKSVSVARGSRLTMTITGNLNWMYTFYFVDWDGDGSFDGEGENLGHLPASSGEFNSTPNGSAANRILTVTIPDDARSGNIRLRAYVCWYEASKPVTACSITDKANAMACDFNLEIAEETAMEVSSVETIQTSSVQKPGNTNIAVSAVLVNTSGTLTPLNATSLDLNYAGTSVNDVKSWKLLYNRVASHKTGTEVATGVVEGNSIHYNFDKELSGGKNYFWIVADLGENAALDNKVDVSCSSITIDGNNYVPEPQNAEGEIVLKNIIDYTVGHAVWFDEPTSSTEGSAVWNTDNFLTSSSNPDQIWERKSLPIGNGDFGGNILGSVSRERITLNEKTLWKGGPGSGASRYWDMNKTDAASYLAQIRENMVNGNTYSAKSLTENHFNGKIDYNSSEVFGSYTTMGEVYVSTGINESAISDYKRILNIDSSLVVIQFMADGVRYQRQYFCSYPDQVMVMRYIAEGGNQDLTFSYNCPQVITDKKQDENGMIYLGKLQNNNQCFALRVYARTKQGNINYDVANGTITVSGSPEVEFILAGDTDYKMNFDPDMAKNNAYVGVDPEVTTTDIIASAKAFSYDELYNRHQDDYSDLYNRVSLAIQPDQIFENEPTPGRLKKYSEGTLDHGLEELYFQFGRYLLISSSRSGGMPANLQGLWHNNVEGPWRVDYHNNINVQMNYWPATCTNLLDCYQPMIDYIKSLVKPGEKTAQAYYNARGWTAAISSNIYGFTAPLSSTDMTWNYNPSAGPWLATHLWEYYDYTRDIEWLRETGYEIIKGSAQFVTDMLYLHDNVFTATPSWSPEHGSIDMGTTYAHAVAREILTDAVAAAELLGIDQDAIVEWNNVLEKLAPYKIGRSGQLQEWYNDIDNPSDDHRHTNHLFGLHPGHSISPLTTPELANACKVTLNQRGDAATGWSMGWKLNHWARLHDGNHAYILFQNLLKNGTASNLWDLHPPFQIDGNFGGTAGVAEMLMQSHMNLIHLLPALPDEWSNGNIKGLLAKGNFIVDIEWENNLLKQAIITSNKGGVCNLHYKGADLDMETEKGNTYRITYDPATEKLSYANSTSIEENETGTDSELIIYPGAEHGEFVILLPEEVKRKVQKMSVYTFLGQQIYVNNGFSDKIVLQDSTQNQCYLLKIQTKDRIYAKKFIMK